MIGARLSVCITIRARFDHAFALRMQFAIAKLINENPRVRKAAQSIGRSLIYMVMARLRSSSRVAEYTMILCLCAPNAAL